VFQIQDSSFSTCYFAGHPDTHFSFHSLDRTSGFSMLSLLTGLVPISIGGSLRVPVPQIC
jgi:hypothetical protein